MSARDELAEALEDVIDGGDDSNYDDMASALMIRGYRKPRTITTVEELDALPGGSVILDALNYCREAAKLTDGNAWRSMGPASVRSSRQLPLPAKVLYVPEVTP